MWLTSYDPNGAWPATEVVLVGQARIGSRTDWAWASLRRPIRLDGQARSRVLLGSRHRGDSVWTQPKRWPMHVYVCVANDDAAQNSDELTRDQVTNAAWGLLHESPERAAADEY